MQLLKILMGLVFQIGFLSMIHAQNTIVSGIVMDSIGGKPLVGATIILKNAEGEPISTLVSNKQGSFSLKVPSINAATLTFSYVQFAEKIINLSVYSRAASLDLGNILLHYDANALDQVIVQGRKPPVVMRFDRQVYKASAYNNAAGGTGVDVLRNLPAISVDAGGGIVFRGSQNFLMLINGKVVQGDPATMLAQIPSGSIENIELITNPSAQYDAEGRSGIINIVTKNFRQEGWVVQSTIMGGLPPFNDYGNERNPRRYSAEISAGFRKNKFDINTSLNYLRNDISGYREGEVFTIIGNTRTDFPSEGERSFERYNYGARVSAGYEFDPNNNLTAGFYVGKRFQIRDANLFYQNTRTDLNSGASSSFNYYNPNRQQKEGNFTLANLTYEHKISKTSSISFTGLYEKANLTGLTTNLNILTPKSVDTLQYTRNPSENPLDAWRLKVDYKNGGLSLGYQFRYDVQDGNFLYLTQVPGTGDFTVDDEFTSSVKTRNFIHAGYIQYDGKAENMTYSGGLRLETTDRELVFSKDNETRNLNLVNFFPNVQLKYALPQNWNVKAGFSRRIRRTNNFELNPFPEREHSETLEQGDPDLLPELIGTIEVGLEHNYTKGNFFFTPYFQSVKNPIQRTNKVYTDTILNRVFTNGEKSTQVGFELGSTHAVTKWWQSIFGFNIYYFTIKGALFNNTVQAENQAWAFTINSTQSFNLGKNWLGQLALNYISDRPTLQGKDSYFLNPSVSVKKTTDDKRWSFQALCQNVDWGWGTSNRQRITTSGSDFFTTTNYIYETNQVQLSVSFNLLKQNRKITVPVSEMGEKEF
jgi:outer membrane receptor protein involved in Fe transport